MHTSTFNLKRGNMDMLVESEDFIPKVYATWSKSTGVLNCIMMLNSSSTYVEKDICVEPTCVKITEGGTVYSFHISDMVLHPKTCRGLRILPSGEVHFSMKGEMRNGVEDPSVHQHKTYSNQSSTVDCIERLQHKWYCATCRQKLLYDWCFFNRVLLLPSENWSDFADMWFCHNHSHGENGDHDQHKQQQEPQQHKQQQGEESQQNKYENEHKQQPQEDHQQHKHENGQIRKKTLLPGVKECFVGETYVLVARRYVNEGQVKVSKAGTVMCRRCGKQLGVSMETDTGSSTDDWVCKLYLHAVVIKDFSIVDLTNQDYTMVDRFDMDSFFSRLVIEQGRTYSSYRFIIEAHDNTGTEKTTTSTCLLWLLDTSVTVFTSDGTSHEQKLKQNSVVKLLFKCQLCTQSSRPVDYVTKSVISLWRKDDTVHGFTLPHPVFLQLIQQIIHNCKQLPHSQRYLNGFHVTYLQHTSETS